MVIRRLLFIIVCVYSLSSFGAKRDVRNLECDSNDLLTVVHLNGIQTSEDTINFSVIPRYKNIISKEAHLAGIPFRNVCFEYTYNQEEGFAEDTLETFGQKFNEAKGLFGVEFTEEDFSLLVFARSNFSVYLLEKLITNLGLDETVAKAYVAGFVEQISLLITFKEINDAHTDTLNLITAEVKGITGPGQNPLVLVSHSQGNLFANELYVNLVNINEDYAKYMKTSFANLQVATPANIIKAPISDYYTHPQDLVIAGFVAKYPTFSIKDPNFRYFEKISDGDPLGHGFIEVYTNENTYGSFDNELQTSSSLEYPVWEVITETGSGYFRYDIYKLGDEVNLVNSDNDRINNMAEVFYEKLNDLALEVTGQMIADCNNDGVRDDPARVSLTEGYIDNRIPNDKISPDLVIADGGRLCGDYEKGLVKVENARGMISGRKTVVENSEIGDKCSNLMIGTTHDQSSLRLNEVKLCTNNPRVNVANAISTSQIIVNKSANLPMTIEDSQIDGYFWILNTNINNKSVIDGTYVVAYGSDPSKTGTSSEELALISDSQIYNYVRMYYYFEVSGKSEIIGGWERDVYVYGRNGSPFVRNTKIEGHVWTGGQVSNSHLKSDSVYFRNPEWLSGPIRVHVSSSGSVSNSTVFGQVSITGSVQNSSMYVNLQIINQLLALI